MALNISTNSYGTRAEADIYFDDSLRKETWKSFSNGDRDKGLIEATRLLERQPWDGEKENPSQQLAFPRTGLIGCAGNTVLAVDSLVLAKEGQYEYALAILQDISIINSTNTTGSNTKKLEAGAAKITYFKPKKGSKYPLQVLTIFKCFFLGNNTGSSMAVSGNCDTSSFTEPDNLGLIRGFK